MNHNLVARRARPVDLHLNARLGPARCVDLHGDARPTRRFHLDHGLRRGLHLDHDGGRSLWCDHHDLRPAPLVAPLARHEGDLDRPGGRMYTA